MTVDRQVVTSARPVQLACELRAVICLAIAVAIAPANASVKYEVSAGFLGHSNIHKPLNVAVTIETMGQPFAGEVKLVSAKPTGMPNLTVESAVRVALGAQARKQFFLQVPPEPEWFI